jgi:ATP adenylyltransferase
MDILWAPWRKEFILSKKGKGCIFCEKLKEKKDKKNLILFRSKLSFILLNKYPYNSGHLMVAPYRHVGKLEKLREEELFDLALLSQRCVKILKKTMKPHGFNLGMNLEKISGAGVADHLHVHVVPRWTGDTNFMPVVGETKLISVALKDVYNQLKDEFKKLKL